MLRLNALRGVQAHMNVAHLQHRRNVMYGIEVVLVELLLQLEN